MAYICQKKKGYCRFCAHYRDDVDYDRKVCYIGQDTGKMSEYLLDHPSSGTVWEWCSNCEQEVILSTQKVIQHCPYCGEEIRPCSSCTKDDCKQCPCEGGEQR